MQFVKGKRGRAKASITNQLAFSELIDDSTTVASLEIHLARLTEAWSEFNSLSDQLYEFIEDEGFVDPEPEYADYEDKYLTSHAAITDAIRAKVPHSEPPPINTAASPSESLTTQQVEFLERLEATKSTKSVHLPQLHVPTFHGNYKDWPGFKDMFLGTIDSNTSLSGTQKFQYLKSFLGKQPGDLFKNTPCTEKNYVEAWDKLEERYDRTVLIIQSFIETFISLPSSNSNPAILRKITDDADEVIRGLNSLDATTRDPWLIYILLQKLDLETKQAWANEAGSRIDLTIQQFLDFLQNRCNCLEACCPTPISSLSKRNNKDVQKSVRSHMIETKVGCPKCGEDHQLFLCKSFSSLGCEARRDFARENKLCFNCFRTGHPSNKCRSFSRCKICNKRHHTLVHPKEGVKSTVPSEIESSKSGSSLSSATSSPVVNCHSLDPTRCFSTLLPTAVVKVVDKQGVKHEVRVLLDTGSQVSFVTEEVVQRLGLTRKPSRIPIMGVGSTAAGVTNGVVSLNLASRFEKDDKDSCSNNIDVDCYVISKLTSLIPPISTSHFNTFDYLSLDLADPSFNKPGPIDILIGADKVFNIITGSSEEEAVGVPNCVPTIFGWVIAGGVPKLRSDANQEVKCFTIRLLFALAFDLERFWRLEEVHWEPVLSVEEQQAEEHFVTTHSRALDGRYVVQLPFKKNYESNLCDSFSIALSRLHSMERRFASNPELKAQYNSFLNEYLALGHMEEVPQHEIVQPPSNCYYLPHHAVIKNDSTTTKLRVVFDGSAKPHHSDTFSLNELLLVGPTIQRDIFAICLRSRRHAYVISGDIEKMFRQIWVAPSHKNYQRIIWRSSPQEPIKHYNLLTVTYGTSAAPFLAVRTLKQLALDNAEMYPRASNIILNDFYVDDVFTGADDVDDIISLRNELVELLKLGGFNLRKWTTNCWPLLLSLPEEQREISPVQFEESNMVKVLGLQWCPFKDCFSYKVVLPESTTCTKRRILSDASRVFDPLGFLSPVVVAIKILIQDLWREKLAWDEEVPLELGLRWKTIRDELSLIESLSIPRVLWSNKNNWELHGFCDASLDAYAAVVYCRSVNEAGKVQISLVAAKSRVAPIKVLSLPKLELCGARLLTQLINKIKISLQENDLRVFAWTDSSIVLHWLSAPPKKWSVFVANRTSEILTSIPFKCWNHVRSPENPADVPSRGIPPSLLASTDIWWNGPSWLKKDSTEWSVSQYNINDIAEEELEERKSKKVQVFFSNLNSENIFDQLIARFSNWFKLVRVVAYIYRFYRNAHFSKNKESSPFLYAQEIIEAKTLLIKHAQSSLFGFEIDLLKKGKPLPSKSKLLPLAPFLDRSSVLRVGGRLEHSHLSYNEKHPIILCKSHPIAKLIANSIHEQYLHSGVTLMIALLKQNFYILGCRNLLQKIVNKCLKCFRQRQTVSTQLMGDLPKERVRFSRPFSTVGCDYAGPITLRLSRGRNPKFVKAYIALFVCFVTKGVHIELVGDLSTDAFLLALDRFVSRRGKPSVIWSDNATNFNGAKRKLGELHDLLLDQQRNSCIIDHLSKDQITWKFIPPASPHFGGLWEAGVKSVKTHLKRVIGDQRLTYEEMYTLLAKIESLLNSRPMWPTPDFEPTALTPSHFMIGESYSTVPSPDVSCPIVSIKNNWYLLQALTQSFWKRWHQEYLTSLQNRPKWQRVKRNLQIDDVVLVKEPNLPPSKWVIGRVTETHLGADERCRVATIKTNNGTYVRPVVKLAPLPFTERPESSRGG
ncbi:uncharacterized protein LOC129908278 [Episyrphus balteatus]|uniref:uncharacterized protein LOC129908278 n=1 Tax=Episyrphus balteatus TaxID=286459 RepID=UPI0024868850|nr:uncharacterized protein LOC129908278 [Episyrphus balteatus]